MTLSPLDQFLKDLETQLPEILSDADLIRILPQIFKSQSALSRMRSATEAPSHFHISKSCIRYLKTDVLEWLKSHYQGSSLTEGRCITEIDNIYGRINHLETKLDEVFKWKPLIDTSIVDINNKLES